MSFVHNCILWSIWYALQCKANVTYCIVALDVSYHPQTDTLHQTYMYVYMYTYALS